MICDVDKKRYQKWCKDNPTIYKQLLVDFSPVTDQWAVAYYYLNNKPLPVCDICGNRLSVSKNINQNRCRKHINTIPTNLHSYESLQKLTTLTITPFIESVTGSAYVSVSCPVHGTYQKKVASILKGMRCGKCEQATRTISSKRISFDTWVERFKQVHGDRYEYKSVIKGVAEIVCKEHGIFKQGAHSHQNGHGCPKCAVEKQIDRGKITTQEFINRAKDKHGSKYDYRLVNYCGAREKVKIVCPEHGEFEQIAYYHSAGGHGCPKCGNEVISSVSQSSAEFEIKEYIESLGFSVIHGYRKLDFELDLYVPEKNLAIEYNGIFWHSSDCITNDTRLKTYHLKKTQACESTGISLLHIFENEWLENPELWKSMISIKLGYAKKIGARSTKIQNITSEQANRFYEDNHMQGKCNGLQISLGLFFNGELVAAMSCGKPRFNKKYDHEILRFCTKKYLQVYGGFSKMIKHFKAQNPGKIVSYANRRWSSGKLYQAAGFRKTHTIEPSFYVVDRGKLKHRLNFTKKQLSKLKNYDSSKTQEENIYLCGFRRIWDCGQIGYELI